MYYFRGRPCGVSRRREERGSAMRLKILVGTMTGTAYVDGPLLARLESGFGSDRLRPYVRPVGCGRTRPLAKMGSAAGVPHRAATSCVAGLHGVSLVLDRSIAPSARSLCKVRPRRDAR